MRNLSIALAIALVGIFVASTIAAAHEGSEGTALAVEPTSVTAGETVVLAGQGLEPGSERTLLLAGGDLLVDLGSVTTDADGMFQVTLTMPSHLPSGTYELRAIGDEVLTVPVAITGGSTPVTSPAPGQQGDTIVPRERSPLELALILAFLVVSLGAGGFLVWRAESFRSEARG